MIQTELKLFHLKPNEALKKLPQCNQSTVYIPCLLNPNVTRVQSFRMWKAFLRMNNFFSRLKNNCKVTLFVESGLKHDVSPDYFDFLILYLNAFFPGLSFEITFTDTLQAFDSALISRKSQNNVFQVDAISLYQACTTKVNNSRLLSLVIVNYELYVTDLAKFVLGYSHFNVHCGTVCIGKAEERKTGNLNGIKILHRLLKSITHEVCHLLGMEHCTIFHCLMNDQSSLAGVEQCPYLLCPFCFAKLQYLLKFDPTKWKTILHSIVSSFSLELAPPFTSAEMTFLNL